MKSFKGFRQGVQGDVALTRVDTLPEGLVEAQRNERGEYIVAHSETGHNHAVAERTTKMYEDPTNPLVAYLVVENTADLEHHRTYNTHETIQFDTGVYRINRQREYTPEGFRRVAD